MTQFRRIVILGAPRSGTTLLRVLLGRHPAIFALPETPWISGGYTKVSIRHLENFLLNDPKGSRNLLQVEPKVIKIALRRLLEATLETKFTDRKSTAQFIAVKTPDDAGFPDFLMEYFPDAYFLHITRDGRDVALSTIETFSQPGIAKVLAEGHGLLTFWNALKRWCYFQNQIQQIPNAGKPYFQLKYENLVADVDGTMNQIFDWLQVPPHNVSEPVADDSNTEMLPDHEAGSRDVRERPIVTPSSVGRWRQLLDPDTFSIIDKEFGEHLITSGYPLCNSVKVNSEPSEPGFLSSVAALHSPYPTSRFRFRLNKIIPLIKDLVPAIRKTASRHIHAHFWEDKQAPK